MLVALEELSATWGTVNIHCPKSSAGFISSSSLPILCNSCLVLCSLLPVTAILNPRGSSLVLVQVLVLTSMDCLRGKTEFATGRAQVVLVSLLFVSFHSDVGE